MGRYSLETAADRAGVEPGEIARLTELGILSNDAGYSDADVRRLQVARALERAGLELESLADLLQEGSVSLRFLDEAGSTVFAALSDVTFAELSERSGVPLEMLTLLREVTGGQAPRPGERVREDELEILPLVSYQVELGFRGDAIERALRVYGDSLRRVAEAEAEWWRSEVQAPLLERGVHADELGHRAAEISPRLSRATDRALVAIYHAQQMHVWSANIVDGITAALEQAGMHTRDEQQPAMCFLDLTGFTQLTQELGDAEAARTIERTNRIVRPISVRHDGLPVKWLGDGVMFHFPDPGAGVLGAIEMVEALADAELPPAHVGLHAGPVVRQEGDYHGQTVNLAARIGEFARPGEVLVSRAVKEASDPELVTFQEIGRVDLKGISGAVELYTATSTSGRRSSH
ncbi:MAG TPA: adenylate/guanylate cyclase domain-containing protein [Actinomycetota bacterium]|jgi:class 3 adenylate cyclase